MKVGSQAYFECYVTSHLRCDRIELFAFSLTTFEHARDHKDHYRALVSGRGGTVSLGTIHHILSDLVRDELAATVHKKSEDVIRASLSSNIS